MWIAIWIVLCIIVLAALSYWAYRLMKEFDEDFFGIDEWIDEEYDDETARVDGEE